MCVYDLDDPTTIDNCCPNGMVHNETLFAGGEGELKCFTESCSDKRKKDCVKFADGCFYSAANKVCKQLLDVGCGDASSENECTGSVSVIAGVQCVWSQGVCNEGTVGVDGTACACSYNNGACVVDDANPVQAIKVKVDGEEDALKMKSSSIRAGLKISALIVGVFIVVWLQK